jgi:hypothetical protein
MDARIRELTADLRPQFAGDRSLLERAAIDLGIRWPADYAAFMAEQDGGEGWVGPFYLSLWHAADLVERNLGYGVAEFAPGLVLFGSDGGGEGFAFDTRVSTATIVMVPFVSFDQPIVQGTTLLELLERLRDDRAFDGVETG